MKAESTYSLKDDLFNPEKVAYLSDLISEVYPEFAGKKFQKQVVAKFPELELKERIFHITDCLVEHLPDSFPKTCSIIVKSLPPELDPEKVDDDFGDFIFAPLSHFVVCQGCNRKHLKRSLVALKEITKRFSAEFAIRYFINEFPDESFVFLEECAKDANYHVRRLASEGSRPRLPWAQNLDTHYEVPLSILHQLHSDSTRYVTRSVANHLNDISKLDADLVVELLKEWRKLGAQSEQELNYMIRHALRTLVKEAHPGALTLLGFTTNPGIKIVRFNISPKRVKIGDAAVMDIEIMSNKKQKLLIDYLLETPAGREKVYKIKQLAAGKGEVISIEKKHPLKLMTSRALLTGEYKVTLQINGKRFDSIGFRLV